MLEQIAKDYGIDVEELKKIETELRAKYQALPDIGIIKGNEEAFIKKGLIVHAKRIKKQNAEQIFGFILKFDQPRSSNNRKMRDAMVEYKKNPQDALNKGLVEEITFAENKYHRKRLTKNGNVGSKVDDKLPNGAINIGDGITYIIPLDNNKVFKSGKANWKYLKALDPDSYFTNLSGYFTQDGKQYNKFRMTINLDTDNIVIPMNKPVKFRASIGDINTGITTLGYKNGITIFEVVEGSIDNLRNEIAGFMEKTDIIKIPEVHANQGTNVQIIGTVSEIWLKEPTDDQPKPFNTLVIEDLSSDVPIRCMCHQQIPLHGCAQGAVVVLWGRTSKGDRYDRDTRQTVKGEVEYGIWASGVYPIVPQGPDEPPKPVTMGNDKKSIEEWT